MDLQSLIGRAGGVSKIAVRLGVSHSAICDWKRSGYIPGGRLMQICREFNLPVHELAPLVKPLPPAEAKAAA